MCIRRIGRLSLGRASRLIRIVFSQITLSIESSVCLVLPCPSRAYSSRTSMPMVFLVDVDCQQARKRCYGTISTRSDENNILPQGLQSRFCASQKQNSITLEDSSSRCGGRSSNSVRPRRDRFNRLNARTKRKQRNSQHAPLLRKVPKSFLSGSGRGFG